MKPLPFLLAILTATAIYAANELQTITGVSYSKNGATLNIQEGALINVTTPGFIDTVVAVGTNETQFSFGSVTNPSVLFVKCLTTNSWAGVRAGSSNGVYFIKVKPSQTAITPLDGTNLFLAAVSTASNQTVLIRVTAIPN